jgi:hypothetical protein
MSTTARSDPTGEAGRLCQPADDGVNRQATRDEQLAFWLNAYDALVLRTVADHYPIQGRLAAIWTSARFPARLSDCRTASPAAR